MKTHHPKTSPLAFHFAKIKDVWLEVANCDFFHSHLGEKDSDGFFLGRKKAKEHLKMLLRHSKSRSGAYLVTGFRGMGKTSLVHEVLKELDDEKSDSNKRRFEKISISLSQDDIRDTDVLRLIARQMASKWQEIFVTGSFWYKFSPQGIVVTMLCTLIALIAPIIWWCGKFSITLSEKNFYYPAIIVFILGAVSLWLAYLHHLLYRKAIGLKNYQSIKRRLDFLNTRLDSMLTQEKSTSFSPEAKSSGGLKFSLFNVSSRDYQSFKIASAKEIEKELIGIFNDIDTYRDRKRKRTRLQRFRFIRHVPDFVFILDELDKIEPDFITTPSPGDSKHSASIVQNTQRRETIARLLSNLKSFLNEAKAKFIFVGGREMYDASLADIADRDTFYGSIFHDVIYLNSFFKDKIQHRSGVTRLTEAYLCHLLIPEWYIKSFTNGHPDQQKVKETDPDEWYNLDTLYHYLVDCQRQSRSKDEPFECWKAVLAQGAEKEMTPSDRAAVYKIIYLLQNFVVYLTYRSNGTPKKLAGLLERYIVPGGQDVTPGNGSEDSYLYDLGFNPQKGKAAFGNEIILFCPPDPNAGTGQKERQNRKWFSFFRTKSVQQQSSSLHLILFPLFSIPSRIKSVQQQSSSPEHNAKGKLFLKFTFNQQYEIGLTSNLYRPYVIIHSRYLKALGDKLLYSTAFIMDYILKFHPHGFSWRNLEMVPDIILTNKDPNLRTFMQELLQFLSRMYIRETINGMFQYRFYSKVIHEIRFLSKISEQGSAAFNFTLDESQQIKHYYRDKLHRQLKQHEEPVQFSHGEAPFVHSIAFLRNLLGDLHYYDKEYDDAIIHYSDAVQPLRERAQKRKLSNHQLVLLVRTQLKLGMALERIKAFDSAYSIYRSLIMDTPRLLKPENDFREEEGSEDIPLSRMQLLIRPYIAILDLIEKQRIDGITFSNLKKNLSSLNTLLDENRPYPILRPKGDFKGYDDNKDSPRLNTLYSDYFSNVGSILYFKNFNFPEVYEHFKRGLPRDRWGDMYKEGFRELEPDNLAVFINVHRGANEAGKYFFDYNPTISAYIYYRQAIAEQVATFRSDVWEALEAVGDTTTFEEYQGRDLQESVLMLHPATGYLTNSMQMFIMGNLFSKLGDAVLSSTGGDVKPLSKEVLELYQKDDTAGSMGALIVECLKGLSHKDFPFKDGLNSTLLLYRISGLFYLKANRSFSCAFQFKKFLFVVKDWLAFRGGEWIKKDSKSEERKMLLKQLDQLLIHDEENHPPSIANRLFRSIVWSSDVANRPQILKYREIFNVERTQDTTSIYNNISTSPEMREVVLLIEEIRLKLFRLGALESPLHLNIITPYDSISSKYLRVLELKYKCEYNFVQIKSILDAAEKLCTAPKISAEEKKLKGKLFNISYFKRERPVEELECLLKNVKHAGKEELVENCVLDSIFCLYEVIRSLNIYGMNYVTNHSFLANAHYKLANWCRAFQNLKYGHLQNFRKSPEANQNSWELRDKSQRFDEKLIKLLGTDALYTLEVNYHNEQALEHYYAAIQTHKGGRSYRDNISNLSFLEDDLNDNLTHFSAAAERFRINTGVIRMKIGKLKDQIRDSQVYDFDSYIGPAPEDV